MVLLESINVPLGTSAPDFSLKNVDGEQYSLGNFADKKALVVVFMCNHCPYVQAIWPRLVSLQEQFLDKEVQFVGINPNLNPDYDEETFEKMQEYYGEYSMNFPYLQDDTQEVARAYDAQCTPDIYVFDEDLKLAYHGRVDDNWKDEGSVTKQELAEAIEAIVGGEDPSAEQRPAMGCSIKWRE
ncbi:thioredoxin family protein [Candidatus Peregrinibacteria bacterium]|jgi:peroxiredoxin|nr:thioredoxin family protein [Candidatus Peregrinibacteria bacterium]MBT7736448.1 thioredoxin family protein [Candidatus Peregrinibacteria bacterium]